MSHSNCFFKNYLVLDALEVVAALPLKELDLADVLLTEELDDLLLERLLVEARLDELPELREFE